LTVDAKVFDKIMTDNGDLERVSIRLAAKLDLAKLPESKPANEEEVTELVVEFTIGVNGATVDLVAVSNPGYKGFQEDEQGMKEILEKLLALDVKTMKDIHDSFSRIDGLAAELVNNKRE